MTRDQFRGCGKRRSGGSSSFPHFLRRQICRQLERGGEMGGREQIAGEEEERGMTRETISRRERHS